MKSHDLLTLAAKNLYRKKLRTFLTTLGVAIGATAVFIMIALGLGMREQQQTLIAEMGDLRMITVNKTQRGDKSKQSMSEVLRPLKHQSNVVAISPKMQPNNVSADVTAGKTERYSASYVSLTGLDFQSLEGLGYTVLSGSPQPGKVLIGEHFAYQFLDKIRPEGRNMVDRYLHPDAKPYFDPTKETLKITFVYRIGESEKKLTMPLEISGILKEDWNKGGETSSGIVMDTAHLTSILNKLSVSQKEKEDAGQTALVKAATLEDVSPLESQIKKLGFQTSSMESLRKPMEQEARQKQMMLGALGAISLFVATLGIANTMVMSIHERFKEIGMMKALGCFESNIQALFLLESAFIGGIGGLMGLAIGNATVVIINLAASGQPILSLQDAAAILQQTGHRTAVAPSWLSLFTLAFAIFLGVFAGYYPARKAARMPILSALKALD